MAFQKGNCANPGGRPKNKPFADALRRMIFQECQRIKPVKGVKYEAGEEPLTLRRPKKITVIQELMRQLLLKGLAGDVPAIKEVMDRTDGKVAQPLQGSDDPDAPPIMLETKEMSTKELARRIGYILLSAVDDENDEHSPSGQVASDPTRK